MEVRGQIIAFPRQLQVVTVEPARGLPSSAAENDLLAMVEHDGHVYDLAQLLGYLAPDLLREIGGSAPRSGQEAWDEVVRPCPALAAEIVAMTGPLKESRGPER